MRGEALWTIVLVGLARPCASGSLAGETTSTNVDSIFVNRYFGTDNCGLSEVEHHVRIEQLEVGCSADPSGDGYRLLEYNHLLPEPIQSYAEKCNAGCEQCEVRATRSFRPDKCTGLEKAGSVLIYPRAVPCIGVGKYKASPNVLYSVEYPKSRTCDRNVSATATVIHIRSWRNVTASSECKSVSRAEGTFYEVNRTGTTTTAIMNCTDATCSTCLWRLNGTDQACLVSTPRNNSAKFLQNLDSCEIDTPVTLPPSPPPPPTNDGGADSREQTAIIIGSSLAGFAVLWLGSTFLFCGKSLREADRQNLERANLVNPDPEDYGSLEG